MGVLSLIICSNLVNQEAEVIVAHPEQILEGDKSPSFKHQMMVCPLLLAAGDPCFLHVFFFLWLFFQTHTCIKKSLVRFANSNSYCVPCSVKKSNNCCTGTLCNIVSCQTTKGIGEICLLIVLSPITLQISIY